MQFAHFNNKSVFEPLLDPHIGAGIGLFSGTQHPVSFCIRLRTGRNQIFPLEPSQPFFKVFVIIGFAGSHFIRFV